ncbi:MAG: hypothetical protein M3Q07_06235 [Pseudobdellovibrionaceae bacterium]|nr:hypothetical protein [Pseudobdellovibrionaceae bacterium]
MKLSSLSAVLLCTLAITACDKKSEKTEEQSAPVEASIIADDPNACAIMSEAAALVGSAALDGSAALHGSLEGFSASEQQKFHVKIDWSSPLVSGSKGNSATVTFKDHHAHAVALKISSFKLFMPAMGHGSSQGDQMVMTQDATNTNVWTVDQIYFSMGGGAGEWVVDIEAGACGVTDKVRVAIPVEVQ